MGKTKSPLTEVSSTASKQSLQGVFAVGFRLSLKDLNVITKKRGQKVFDLRDAELHECAGKALDYLMGRSMCLQEIAKLCGMFVPLKPEECKFIHQTRDLCVSFGLMVSIDPMRDDAEQAIANFTFGVAQKLLKDVSYQLSRRFSVRSKDAEFQRIFKKEHPLGHSLGQVHLCSQVSIYGCEVPDINVIDRFTAAKIQMDIMHGTGDVINGDVLQIFNHAQWPTLQIAMKLFKEEKLRKQKRTA